MGSSRMGQPKLLLVMCLAKSPLKQSACCQATLPERTKNGFLDLNYILLTVSFYVSGKHSKSSYKTG